LQEAHASRHSSLGAMALDTLQALGEPRAAHRIDEGSLLTYLRKNIPELATEQGPLRVSQFQHGQSNPTYLLQLGNHRYVLRKKPPGKLLASAHAVDREYRVLSALYNTRVPVPRPLVLCEDPEVLGTSFYIMSFAEGRIFLDAKMRDAGPRDRSRVYARLIDILADLHAIDPATVGLGNYGNPMHYCRRQVARWSRQYKASMPQPAEQVLQLIDWLEHNVPAEDADPPQPAICHGDYRLDNLVFDQSLQVTTFRPLRSSSNHQHSRAA
jgi:aminoglycoside phosphotransferase (APT) family kinase protein